jgi:hypothetical protein
MLRNPTPSPGKLMIHQTRHMRPICLTVVPPYSIFAANMVNLAFLQLQHHHANHPHISGGRI